MGWSTTQGAWGTSTENIRTIGGLEWDGHQNQRVPTESGGDNVGGSRRMDPTVMTIIIEFALMTRLNV